MYKRTDSAGVFDSGKPDIKVFASGSTARFLFGGKVLVRFKKATRKGRGSNIPTGANDNFLDPAIPFEDAPQAMKVEICWKVNELGTGCITVYVTARNGDGKLWSYELPGGQQGVIEFSAEDRCTPAAPPQRGEAQGFGQDQEELRRRSVLTACRRLTGRQFESSPNVVREYWNVEGRDMLRLARQLRGFPQNEAAECLRVPASH